MQRRSPGWSGGMGSQKNRTPPAATEEETMDCRKGFRRKSKPCRLQWRRKASTKFGVAPNFIPFDVQWKRKLSPRNVNNFVSWLVSLLYLPSGPNLGQPIRPELASRRSLRSLCSQGLFRRVLDSERQAKYFDLSSEHGSAPN